MQALDFFRKVEGYAIKSIFDKEEHIELVVKHMPEYSKVKRELVQISNVSAGGGAQTWKVYCQDSECEALIVHSRMTEPADPQMEYKLEAFQEVMYKAGVAPPRYVSGETWWIEPFFETKDIEGATMEQKAMLAATMHKASTDWFTPSRDKLRELHPHMKKASDHSFIWGLMKGNWLLMHNYDDPFVMEHMLEYEKLKPRSEPGKRIVSCHNDTHNGNYLLRKDDGKLFIIDFEFGSVGYAARDLAFLRRCSFVGDEDSMEDIKKNDKAFSKFLEVYLKELGYPAEEKDIQDLKYDINTMQATCLHGPADSSCTYQRNHPEPVLSFVPRLLELQDKWSATPELKRIFCQYHCIDFDNEKEGDPAFIKIGQEMVEACIPGHKTYLAKELKRCFSDEKFAEICQKAQEKGIKRLEQDVPLSYTASVKLAADNNATLCTKEELIDAGLCVFDFPFSQFCRTEDGEKDMIVLGPDYFQYKSYGISHKDDLSTDFWDKEVVPDNWRSSRRPGQFIFVKEK